MPTATPVATAAPTATPTLTPTPLPAATPTQELRQAANKIQPAVVLVTVFDLSGKLLRNCNGFYVSSDGRLATDLNSVADAAYAVAKSPDGKIRNVSGVVGSAQDTNLAILRAETKTGVPYLSLSENSEPKDLVGIVGSTLANREQPLAAVTLSPAQKDLLEPSVPLAAGAIGSPAVDASGAIVGIVVNITDGSGSSRPGVRSSTAVQALLAQTKASSRARWLVAGAETPTPTPSPKKLRVIFSPAPFYPDKARSARPPITGTGRFRVIFGADGLTKEVQIVQSTGQPILDQAAVTAFRQWKSEPSHEWSIVVPITFRP
jgi:TonB family protein